MRSAIRASACAVGLAAALCAPAVAAPANGQLAAVVDGRLMTLNPDGSGLRTLPVTGPIAELAFSPAGNRLAFVREGSVSVIELSTGRELALAAGTNIGWSADGTRIAFRRGSSTYTVPSSGGFVEPHSVDLAAGVTQFAWAPGLTRVAPVIDGLLGLAENAPVTGAPAWSPDGRRIAFANAEGLLTIPAQGGAPALATSAPAVAPRWSPDSTALVYGGDEHVRIVPAGGGEPRNVISGMQRVTVVDWQPCSPGLTRSCESVRPPQCTATTASVTMHTDEPVDLPAPPCSDPANRPLAPVVVRGPEKGTLAGWRYVPAAGFSGQDAITYRVSNGATESELIRLTLFVVPRAAPVTVAPRPAPRGAPFLTATRLPRLNARRRAVVRLSCDQDCTFGVRLSARLRGGKRIKGRRVTRTLPARGELRLRLRLPRKPRGQVKRVWITGRVTGASGESRRVRLPVRRPR